MGQEKNYKVMSCRATILHNKVELSPQEIVVDLKLRVSLDCFALDFD